MSEQEVLAKLHDITLPLAIGYWPLAYGWYLVLFLAFISGFFLFWLSARRFRAGRPKHEALKLLKACQKKYSQEPNPLKATIFISELLRRVALAYFPPDQVASLQGEDWIHFLNKESKALNFHPLAHYLTDLPYQKNATMDPAIVEQLFTLAKVWIRQREKRCFN